MKFMIWVGFMFVEFKVVGVGFFRRFLGFFFYRRVRLY